MSSVVTWSAGQTVNYTLAGTAVHGGGSCQLSMSYDLGITWAVIYSHIGGCLIDGMTEEVVIPKDAPSGEALFSWGWFNLQGNREMCTTQITPEKYCTNGVSRLDQNCAVVTIENGGDGLLPSKYPTPFVANAGKDINDCVTIENTAVVFPEPGSNIRYGGTYKDSKPTTPAGFTGSNCVGPGASSGTGGGTGGTSSNSQTSIALSTASATTTSTSSSAAHTTLFTVPSASATLSDISNPSASSASLPSSSQTLAAAAATKTCNRRKRSVAEHVERRHQRLIRRPISRSEGTKRIAAQQAQHTSR
jgi:hypothetical protein